MKIFVMRHGEAKSMASSDKLRQLTEKGKLQSYQQGQWLQSFCSELDKVLVSPYIRAQETFEQIDLAYKNQLNSKFETWSGITPYGDASVVKDYLDVLSQEGVKHILIISHLPLVGDIVRELCGKNTANFYPATIVEIEYNAAHCGIVKQIQLP
ncbi:phosphohistidine phosphatase SixA [Avibacterium paragallinarum]|uniref:Phosphohistidine phosphatase SixA n=1 Tax=Avibacterium paragallinarum TaxID=728 RepID=A0AAE5TJK9_AVIPA|nr:phosphohistidine phosphatase SixA [Avibacterium paragallinarum]MEE3609298.1 phosphohistidine phosphatase SixA [Avibacterium paragallinarum]MEE3620816.1 phosphohistidine phosphatase SixA [Avibacterium paragallinarum]MEE3669672.1 phosphohistidine phosphatase SixA [Avibacterium paragallinarum]MEE3681910.1 phosphohistidine phosphatase SixA [Avibacterium paragallinarum]MEE4386575.1 phosphohistidine phosphatase SixA [Avibacterium paragallinarum]